MNDRAVTTSSARYLLSAIPGPISHRRGRWVRRFTLRVAVMDEWGRLRDGYQPDECGRHAIHNAGATVLAVAHLHAKHPQGYTRYPYRHASGASVTSG